jgi:hypothetical protein
MGMTVDDGITGRGNISYLDCGDVTERKTRPVVRQETQAHTHTQMTQIRAQTTPDDRQTQKVRQRKEGRRGG